MHGLIPRLMPLSLDTLGLAETLENLVRDWQRRYPGDRAVAAARSLGGSWAERDARDLSRGAGRA